MGRQQKNIILLVVCLFVLGGLAGFYFWQRNNTAIAEAEAAALPSEEPENLQVIERSESVVSEIEFTNANGTVKLAERDAGEAKEWYLVDYPNVPLNQSAVSGMTGFASALTAKERIAETVTDKAEYGLEPGARAVATYADGGTEVVHIGSATPDKASYYMTIEGDPALYLVTSSVGERYFYGYGDVIDRALPAMNLQAYDYLLINERGREPMEFDFIGTPEEREQALAETGSVPLSMIQPYYGRALYFESMSAKVLESMNGITLGELAEIEAEDLSEFGLDEPGLEFRYKSGEDEIHLFLGDKTGDEKIYAKLADSRSVFLMDYAFVSTLFGVEPFSVIDSFIALVNIDVCESIDIDSAGSGTDYELVLNHETLPPEEGAEEGEKIIKPTVNGAAVDDEKFRDVYRLIIGITPDKAGEGVRPSGEPEFSIAINTNDGSESPKLSFYEYDANFYSVWREGEDLEYITNARDVDLIFEGLMGLTSL